MRSNGNCMSGVCIRQQYTIHLNEVVENKNSVYKTNMFLYTLSYYELLKYICSLNLIQNHEKTISYD